MATARPKPRRRWGRLLGTLVLLTVGLAAFGLFAAHRHIRGIDAPIPAAELLVRIPTGELPTAIYWINTSSQRIPRKWMLDPGQDKDPLTKYELAHPAFVLRWSDGRLLLVDTGMTPSAAASFAKKARFCCTKDAGRHHGSVATALGDEAKKVSAVVFTHLHEDHTEGLRSLCEHAESVAVLQSPQQATEHNYLTRKGQKFIDQVACADQVTLQGRAPYRLPGLDGVSVTPVAGHTPGTQLVTVHVRSTSGVKRYVLAGDVANVRDGIVNDIPKPWAYRYLTVPEDDVKLGAVRRFLRGLERDQRVEVVVSHDLWALKAGSIPVFARASNGS